MGLTRTQRLAAQAAIQVEDRSRCVWADPLSGWAVHQLTTLGDFWREGHLMANCLRYELYEDPRVWALSADATMQDFPEDLQDYGFRMEGRMDEPLEAAPMFSLRDCVNHPRVNFELDTRRGVPRPHALAGHDNSLPRPAWLDLIDRAAAELGWARISDEDRARSTGMRLAHSRVRAHTCAMCSCQTSERAGAVECERCLDWVCRACASDPIVCRACTQMVERIWWPGLSRAEAALQIV
jgi:hypothetical protein